MDRVRNPFAPGAGSRPRALAGRGAILEDAETALKRALIGRSFQSQMLLGLRGVGKTVLLNEIEDRAKREGYETSFVEAPEHKNLPDLLYPEMRQILRRLSTIEAARASTMRAFGALRNFASIFKIKIADVEIGVDPVPGEADSGDLERDLVDLFLLIGEAAQAAERGWVLLVDEIQYLDEPALSAIIVAIHRITQKSLPVVFMGAGLPQIARLSGDAKSYSERLFVYPAVGPLDRQAACEALRKPIEDEGANISDPAVATVVARTHGYPFFIQEWGHHAWNEAADSEIKNADVERATQLALKRLDQGFFNVRIDRLTAAEVDYVRAMASIGQGPYRTTDVARQLGKKPTSLGPRRDSLIKKGMAYSPSYGNIDFTVPLFNEFLVRRYGPLH
jgi:hypothetical protein